MEHQSIQDKYAPQNICFGCGPANPKGLHIKSFPKENGEVVAVWTPEPHHQAFPNVLNGGIIGALLDCHSNWTAAWHLMKQAGESRPPCTVTAEYTIKLHTPTPTDGPLQLIAKVIQSSKHSATVEGKLIAHGNICATSLARFVAVKPDHPAYIRW